MEGRAMTERITLKLNEHQPRKAELETDVSLDVPGNTIAEQMDALAAVIRTVEIEHEAVD